VNRLFFIAPPSRGAIILQSFNWSENRRAGQGPGVRTHQEGAWQRAREIRHLSRCWDSTR